MNAATLSIIFTRLCPWVCLAENYENEFCISIEKVIVEYRVRVLIPWHVDSPSQEASMIFASDIGFSWRLMLQKKPYNIIVNS